MEYPQYTGFDISKTAIKQCSKLFNKDEQKSFIYYETLYFNNKTITADLTLALDVIGHLVEKKIYEQYLENLFSASKKWVIIHDINEDDKMIESPHCRRRRFVEHVEKKGFGTFVGSYDNPSKDDQTKFYVFKV